jgi:hypothetical protein
MTGAGDGGILDLFPFVADISSELLEAIHLLIVLLDFDAPDHHSLLMWSEQEQSIFSPDTFIELISSGVSQMGCSSF